MRAAPGMYGTSQCPVATTTLLAVHDPRSVLTPYPAPRRSTARTAVQVSTGASNEAA
jgi:hypothetical protein